MYQINKYSEKQSLKIDTFTAKTENTTDLLYVSEYEAIDSKEIDLIYR